LLQVFLLNLILGHFLLSLAYSGCALPSFKPLTSAQDTSKRARSGEDNQENIHVISKHESALTYAWQVLHTVIRRKVFYFNERRICNLIVMGL